MLVKGSVRTELTCFSKGANELTPVVRHIQDKLIGLNHAPGKHVHVHATCATGEQGAVPFKTADSVCKDTKAVNIVLAALQEQIISKVLNSMLLL
jgi:hypothetical protein